MIAERLPENSLLTALYQRISGDVSTAPLYDDIPEDASFPYIAFGDVRDLDDGDADHGIPTVFVELYVFSADQGAKESVDISAEVLASITRADLVVGDNWGFVDAQRESFSTVRVVDSEGVISRQALLVMKIELEDQI